jgi:hypothetical protein
MALCKIGDKIHHKMWEDRIWRDLIQTFLPYQTFTRRVFALRPHTYKPRAKEDSMNREYRILKPLCLRDFIKAHKKHHSCFSPWSYGCSNFREDVLAWLEADPFHQPLNEKGGQFLDEIFKGCNFTHEFIPHLIKYGFIEEVNARVQHRIGNRYRCKVGVFKDVSYLLASLAPRTIGLINLSTGARFTDPVEVIDVDNITINDFGKATGSVGADNFELLEESK